MTAPFLPVFRIRGILARIRIIGSVPEKTDPDTYKYLWTLDIKVIFLVVLKWKKIQICSYPDKNLISSQKFRDISQNFVSSRDTKFAKFREITKK
jgi:hypothetical protein